jgi:hypothetical protein
VPWCFTYKRAGIKSQRLARTHTACPAIFNEQVYFVYNVPPGTISASVEGKGLVIREIPMNIIKLLFVDEDGAQPAR